VLERFLVRVFDGTEPHFVLTPERFEPAYRELERLAVDGRTETVLLTLLRGITTEAGELQLAEGLLLAPPDCLEDIPPDASWIRRSGPALIVAIAPGDGPEALARAFDRLRDLQTAMRLFAGGVCFEPLAWVRGEGTPWRALPLGFGGRSDGNIVITADQEDELRAFCNLVVRRRPGDGEVAWALERFEFGCEREDVLCALTDHLMALRVLLEPEGPRSGRLAGRLAALCAGDGGREALAERVARAIALEQSLIGGLKGVPGDATTLAAEIESHLRALLRDMVCGHLNPPFDVLADELIERRAPAPPDPEPEPAQESAAILAAVAGEQLPLLRNDYEDLEVWGEPALRVPGRFDRPGA
jgi:hypothetical protein